MRYLLLVLFCFSGFGLVADTLRNKTFTKPLVLKAEKNWVVENCRFEGNGTGTGLEITGKATISNCTFRNLNIGVLYKGSGTTIKPLSFTKNKITDCKTGLYLKEGNIDLDFRCNEFKVSCMNDYPSNGPAVASSTHPCFNQANQVGLLVGENVAIDGNIGGPGGTASPIVPAGNVWPVGNKSHAEILTSSYNLVGWEHLPSFTAVVNESENQWTYFHFRNEFFNSIDNSSSGLVLLPSSQRYAQTSTSQQIPSALSGQVDLVCEGVFNSIVFPLLPRQATVNELTSTPHSLHRDEAVLRQNVPNPALQTTTISFYLPSSNQRSRLEVFDLATGRVLKGFDILQSGHGAIEFETRSLASGIYGFRLLENGRPIAYKKMVISH